MEIDDKELLAACKEHGVDFDVVRGNKCPYCGEATEYVDSSKIYGRSYGMVYLCEPCDAYVGVHHKTSTESKGSVANGKLREWRKKAHFVFDPIAKEKRKGWNRYKAYGWLRREMNLPRQLCHIGMFSVNNCKRVIEICQTKKPY